MFKRYYAKSANSTKLQKLNQMNRTLYTFAFWCETDGELETKI